MTRGTGPPSRTAGAGAAACQVGRCAGRVKTQGRQAVAWFEGVGGSGARTQPGVSHSQPNPSTRSREEAVVADKAPGATALDGVGKAHRHGQKHLHLFEGRGQEDTAWAWAGGSGTSGAVLVEQRREGSCAAAPPSNNLAQVATAVVTGPVHTRLSPAGLPRFASSLKITHNNAQPYNSCTGAGKLGTNRHGASHRYRTNCHLLPDKSWCLALSCTAPTRVAATATALRLIQCQSLQKRTRTFSSVDCCHGRSRTVSRSGLS